MKQGFIIPVYRHGKAVCSIVEELLKADLPIILIDDGNDAQNRIFLQECASKSSLVVLVTLEKNSGKGKAFAKGIKKAKEMGLTHVLQIDADGQHDCRMVKFFLEESEKYPGMIICGFPVFDESAPKSRVVGRRISTFWAAIVTLSLELKDTHCGFRVYPVDASLRITKNPFLDGRMGFDTEILVRLYWDRVFPVFYPINVNYPKNGISNFRMVRDNLRISWVFTRLFIGMLFRLPFLIIKKRKRRKKV